ncbi:carbohydrate ABC transporter permease [Actinomyces viscosus]|uniref:sn-glycerol-3-phosphate transport system permease protein ugpA n=1 Tax=Actinomyces viscosus TaxID=1656 RepID=A0A3S4VCJ4_ACTVI|nr:sugar ABC transporter permease [Actinomyces viscosus]VEI14546.1 sn-glycerol-3-phosphate transport system permease protein ugpA [Actinomyces viscosus]
MGTATVAESRGNRGGLRSRLRVLAYLAPGMTGFIIFIAIPLIASLIISLFSWSLLGTSEFIGVENYRRMFSGEDPAFYTILRNTVVFALLYTAANLIISTGISYWLQHLPSRFSRTLRIIFFIPVVTPMAGNALIWRLLLNDDGVVNSALNSIGVPSLPWLNNPNLAMTSLVIMSLWQGLGYNIVVLTAGLNGINPSVLEASELDGATGVRRFFQVVFPILSPTFFFCTVMTVIGAFKVFAQPFFLTKGGPGESTNTIVLALYRNGFSFDKLGYASALAWVLFVIVMLLTALQFSQQKRWVNYDS